MSVIITITENRGEDGSLDMDIVADDTGSTPFERQLLRQVMELLALSGRVAANDEDVE